MSVAAEVLSVEQVLGSISHPLLSQIVTGGPSPVPSLEEVKARFAASPSILDRLRRSTPQQRRAEFLDACYNTAHRVLRCRDFNHLAAMYTAVQITNVLNTTVETAEDLTVAEARGLLELVKARAQWHDASALDFRFDVPSWTRTLKPFVAGPHRDPMCVALARDSVIALIDWYDAQGGGYGKRARAWGDALSALLPGDKAIAAAVSEREEKLRPGPRRQRALSFDGDLDAFLERNREPAIWMVPSSGMEPPALSLGGLPHLPPNIAWPRAKTQDAPALHFVAEIDCARLPRTPLYHGGPRLPDRGALFFFLNLDYEDTWSSEPPGVQSRVIYCAEGLSKNEYRPPQDLPAIYSIWKPWGSGAEGDQVYRRACFRAAVIDTFNGVPIAPVNSSWGEDQKEAWRRTLGSMTRTGAALPKLDMDIKCHQLLGAPVESIWQSRTGQEHPGIAKAALRYEKSVLLLQIHTEGKATGMMFGDCGLAQFFIEPADLERYDFSKVVATINCH